MGMHKTALASACMAAACVAMLFAASGGSSVELEAGGRRRRAEAFDVDKVFHKAFREGEEDEGDEGVARIRLHHRAKWLADGEKKEDTFASSYSGRREAEESRGGSSSHGSTRRRISDAMGALRRKLDGDDARVEYATSLHKKSAARSEDDGGVEGILNMALSAYGEKKHQRWKNGLDPKDEAQYADSMRDALGMAKPAALPGVY